MDASVELAVLMALRVRGRADAAHVARAAGCEVPAARERLEALAANGAAAPVATAAGSFTLTDAGRAALGRALAAESIDRRMLASLYERFLAVDRTLKEAITAWQLAADAGKPAARDAVLTAAASAGGVAADVARAAPRFAPYPRRVADAAAAVATGDASFVASPRVDSLHQVWFELHEDLLVTLGRTRDA
jgi:hypothetical protein